MTDKKERILQTALELFANDGYNATSTSKIARLAEVSEGLIFRHFDNKEGLLQAIIQDAEERISRMFAPIIFEDNPKQVIRKVIENPYKISQSEYDFWKLQFKLKWEEKYNNPHKMQPLIDKLTWAFEALGYPHADYEAQLLNQAIESLSIAVLRDGATVDPGFRDFLLAKYGV